MAGVQDTAQTQIVRVKCTETRDFPSMGIIARIGEERDVEASVAEALVASGCFVIVEQDVPEEDETQEENKSEVSDKPARRRHKRTEE